MTHAYRQRGEDPTGTSVADIRQRVALELDPYERVLPDQQLAIQEVRADPQGERTAHLQARYRFSESKHERQDITAVATGLLKALPVGWGTIEYHRCPHDRRPDQRGPCPDWTREATIGTPPGRL